ncbi:MAG: hypothetical protein JSW58_15560 [Candidatus Latescibacterota bacterium]|nr:MAG: hypothetical protein JSW58_15560 [Candidatus Latescibacterota bacterium]
MARILTAVLVACVTAALIAPSVCAEEFRTNTAPGLGDYDVPFWHDAVYRDDVQSPSDFLGLKLGARPVTYDEIVRYITYLERFPNVTLVKYGETYEGRDLHYLTITSEENSKRLADIQKNIAKLADPRLLAGESEARAIIEDTPAVAWLLYSIHGDELSSSDAALQLAYQLVAGEDEMTRRIRDEVVCCIDPLENPDGRARWTKQIEQWNGVIPNDDIQSMQHRGVWPYGRGNHYLFDLNRDWFATVHPESRGKIRAILDWNPQFLTDCHEMGPLNTYLFSPPREPFNPFMISQIHKWWKIFAKDQGAAFDRYGWSYYTRDWNEEFYPGYGSSWGIYIGAIGMLYEQAGVDGSRVKRKDGTVMTFRETIHHQFTSSMANIGTVASNRKALLEDYFAEKKKGVGRLSGKSREKSRNSGGFVFPPSSNEDRLSRFRETLSRQDITGYMVEKKFTLRRAMSGTGKTVNDLEVPAGSYVVPLDQPQRALLEAILTFDIRLPTSFLETERKELLKNNRTRLYEITAWSLPLAYNLECYFTEKLPVTKTNTLSSQAAPKAISKGGLVGESAQFGYVFDVTDDRSYSLLARLFQKNTKIWCAKKPFEVEGTKFPRGSFLIKRSGNPDLDESELDQLARDEGVVVHAVNTALATSGVDLGGDQFALLQVPRIGVVGGSGVGTTSFGAVWHLLDSRLRYPMSALDVAALGGADLRKYNVIVLPSAWGGPRVYNRVLGKDVVKRLKSWVESGGTLIALGAASAFLADSTVALSSVRQRRQVLEKLDDYDRALAYAKTAVTPEVDSLAVWEGPQGEPPAKEDEKDKKERSDKRTKPTKEALKEADETARRLRPHGAILAVELDETHWLAFGERSPVPVMVFTDYAYLAKKNIQVAGRFAGVDKIRISGLLWPEARSRWSDTAYATRERVGNGQVVLFAGVPGFRGYFHGSERLLLNAMFLGPGFGTNQVFY